jgi:protein O-GlcNAc transferase
LPYYGVAQFLEEEMRVWISCSIVASVFILLSIASGEPSTSCSVSALSLYENKQYQEAQKLLQACLDAQPQDAAAHELMGLVLTQSGAPAGAAEHLGQALALAGKNNNYRFNLAMFLAKNARIEEADEVARPLLTSMPGADSYGLVGYIQLEQHEEKEAAEYFEKMVAEAPRRADAWYWLGFCRHSLGEFTAALSAYRRAIELDPLHARARLQLAKVLLLLGDYAAANAQLRESIRLEPGRASTWRYLCEGQLFLGDLKDAQESARKAVALSPSDPRGHDQFGRVLKRSGENAAAEAEFNVAERLRAERPSGTLATADLEER